MDEARQIIARLHQLGATLSTAESCTGGLIGKYLTDVSGSSAVYLGGVISYCNAVKQAVLGVDRALLEQEGAVCAAVAMQMAEGVRRIMATDFAVSTTGVAGPNSDERGNPVGLVYVAAASATQTVFRELHLSGIRNEIRKQTAEAALSLVKNLL